MHRYALGEKAFVRSLTGVRRWLESALRSSVLLVGILLLAFPRAGDAAPEGRNCSAEPTDMFIEYGDLINCAIDVVGDIDVLRFTGGSGETVRIQVTGGPRFDPRRACFELFDPEGMRIPGGLLCGDGRGTASRDYSLERTGTHTILMTELLADETLAYGLLLERVSPPSPTAVPIEANQLTEGELDVGDADVFFLSGTAGDTVRVQILGFQAGATLTSPCFQIYDPDGNLRVSACANSSADYQLDVTGRHTVLVTEAFLDEALSFSLSHACILGTCADTNIRPLQASGCLDVKGVPLADRVVRLTQPNERRKSTRTNVRGCFAFDVVRGKPYELEVAGPDVPE